METKDYRDKLLLSEIASNDLEMTKDAIKNATRYAFGNKQAKALEFTRHCIKKTFERLGIRSNRPPKDPKARKKFEYKLSKKMIEKKIEMEVRRNYKDMDTWRNGIYIYQNGELVTFVSSVLLMGHTTFDKEKLSVTGREQGFFVITNAVLDVKPKIYLINK